ncbi:MAG: lipoprotein insertase outer membrane protein LolB [Leptothrix sp. (in: b-proteobacteria)]|jgi:outer membrane lipoprotein LolB
MAVRIEGDSSRSFSADFELQGTADTGRLQLSSALGTSLARAQWTPGQIHLQTTDGSYRFADLESLAVEALGEPIPLAALIDWLQARPWPAAPSAMLDAGQPAKGFSQLGWDVLLDRYGDGLVVATRRSPAPVVSVRAKLDPP